MVGETKKPHAVCIPFPLQGHINPMLKLAKILHHKGFYVTFINTEYNQNRLVKSRGSTSAESTVEILDSAEPMVKSRGSAESTKAEPLDALPDFKFETIPDGLPVSGENVTRDVPSLCVSITENCLEPFRGLLAKLKDASGDETKNIPPVSCIVSGALMSFTFEAAREFGIPEMMFWTASACGLLGYAQFRPLLEKGYFSLKEKREMTNEYLDTKIDWIPGMKGDITLRDLPSFIRSSSDDTLFNFVMNEVEKMSESKALILNTLDELEHDSLNALSAIYPPTYCIGPLPLILDNLKIEDERLRSLSSSLWKEDPGCIEWLNAKDENSVVYVNFGSIAVMTADRLAEFAWGLANSKMPFLWIIRPDLVSGESGMNLSPEFVAETKERGMLVGWCNQEQVLNHPAIGGFLTHSGWNSTFESICGGVPVISWPFYAEQPTNCRYSRVEWGIGMEIRDVKRDKVEDLVRELMEGENGEKMRKKALEWKSKAEAAAKPGGSSWQNLDNLCCDLASASLENANACQQAA